MMMRKIRSRKIGALALVLAMGFAPTLSTSTAAQADAPKHTVTIFAASSLTQAYTALADKFQKAFPEIKVSLVFGSSTTLATQINAGAPADIFAAADPASMSIAAAEFPNPKNYVTNQVILAVPISSAINSFASLNGSVKWIQCGHTVPCGVAADSGLKSDGVVTSSPVSLEGSDASALAKLLAGVVDAALIYKTDVIANPAKIRAIPFAHPDAAVSQYQIAISNSKSSLRNPWVNTAYSFFTESQAKTFLKQSGFTIN